MKNTNNFSREKDQYFYFDLTNKSHNKSLKKEQNNAKKKVFDELGEITKIEY